MRPCNNLSRASTVRLESIAGSLTRARRAPIIALALVLALPSLAIGFYTDDWVTLGYLEHRFEYDPPWWDVFVQTPSGHDAVRRLIASGEIPGGRRLT